MFSHPVYSQWESYTATQVIPQLPSNSVFTNLNVNKSNWTGFKFSKDKFKNLFFPEGKEKHIFKT